MVLPEGQLFWHPGFYDDLMIYDLHDKNDYYTRIGSGAFQLPSSTFVLPDTSLRLPEKLVNIGDGAFERTAARYVEASSRLETIGSRAFANSAGLVAVKLPSKVRLIAEDAFVGCSKNLVFLCPRGSYAWNWAVAHGYRVMENMNSNR